MVSRQSAHTSVPRRDGVDGQGPRAAGLDPTPTARRPGSPTHAPPCGVEDETEAIHAPGFWATTAFNCARIGNGALQRSISILVAMHSRTPGTPEGTAWKGELRIPAGKARGDMHEEIISAGRAQVSARGGRREGMGAQNVQSSVVVVEGLERSCVCSRVVSGSD